MTKHFCAQCERSFTPLANELYCKQCSKPKYPYGSPGRHTYFGKVRMWKDKHKRNKLMNKGN